MEKLAMRYTLVRPVSVVDVSPSVLFRLLRSVFSGLAPDRHCHYFSVTWFVLPKRPTRQGLLDASMFRRGCLFVWGLSFLVWTRDKPTATILVDPVR